MRGWQIAFLLSCALHLSLFNLPNFSSEIPSEEITKRSPISLRMIDRPPAQKKPSVKRIAQKPKDQPRKLFRKKMKKVEQKKKLAKVSLPRSGESKQKKLPLPSIEPLFSARSVPQLVLPQKKQTEVREVSPIEVASTPPKQASAPKIAAVQAGGRGFFRDLKIIHRLLPVYPLSARREGREGMVRIKIQILETGDLGSVELFQTSGSIELDNAALKAVQSWRFEPAMRNGVPIRQSAIFPVAFVLD